MPASAAPEVQSEPPAAEAEGNVEAATLEAEALRAEPEVQRVPQASLIPFDATARTAWAILFAFTDYLELVDWTGRAVRGDKRGHIGAHQPRIRERLGIDGERFQLDRGQSGAWTARGR